MIEVFIEKVKDYSGRRNVYKVFQRLYFNGLQNTILMATYKTKISAEKYALSLSVNSRVVYGGYHVS